nr:carboxypeptidase-like regulatory domain-containing protein [Bacteroidia bacterium]
MKNSKIYLLCTLLFLTTMNSFGQNDTSFSFNLKNVSIPEFANQIEAKSTYRVFYNPDIFDRIYISFNSSNKSIRSILTSVFEGSDIYFSIDLDNHIFLTKGQPLNFTTSIKRIPNASNNLIIDSSNDNDQELLDGKSLQSGAFNKLIQIGVKVTTDKRNTAVINGVLKNKKNGEPVLGASIFIDNPKIGVVSDQYGSFVIELPKGKNILHVQSLGMRDLNQPILLNGDGKIMIDLTESVTSLKKVVISAQKISNIRGTQMGVQRIDIKTLKQVPVAFGESDILKVVTTIPGVKTVGEASSGLNVRGGSADQNLILFNDGTIYNPTHLFGLFSAFNPEVIKNVELYKGTIPAEYGGRLSSVLEINSREGNKKNVTGSAGIGLLTSRLNLEGPLVKDKSSFVLGGRTTYSNWLFKLLPEEYKNSKASFYDVNFSINHEMDKKNTLYFSAYTSGDQFNLNSDTLYGYGNKNFSLKL